MAKCCKKVLITFLFIFVLTFSFGHLSVSSFYLEADKTFGSEGMLRTGIKLDNPVNTAYFYEARVQKDNKIVVCGQIALGANNIVNMLLARFNQDGTIDKEFGDDGYVRLRTLTGGGIRNELCERIELEGDKIIFAGRVTAGFGNGADYDLVVGRLNPDGSLDTSFAQYGYAFYDLNRSNETIVSLMLQDSKYILGLIPGDVSMIRFNHDGSLDTSFGNGGAVSYSLFERHIELGRTFGVAPRTYLIGKDGMYYASISSSEEDMLLYLLRIDKTGRLDNTFDSKGYKELVDGVIPQNIQNQTAINSKGEFFVFSDIFEENLIPKIRVAKAKSSGEIDSNFGTGGSLTTQFIDNPSNRRYTLTNIKSCSDGEGKYAAVANDNLVFRLDTFFSIIDVNNLSDGIRPQSTFYTDLKPKYSGMNVLSCFFYEGNYYMVSPESVTKVLVYNQVILPKELHAFDGDKEITYPSGKGVIGKSEIIIKKEKLPGIVFTTDLKSDLNLNTTKLSFTDSKILVEEFEYLGQKSILVPKDQKTELLLMCPNITQAAYIRKYCLNMQLLNTSSLKTQDVEGVKYWLVPFTARSAGVMKMKDNLVQVFSSEIFIGIAVVGLLLFLRRKKNR